MTTRREKPKDAGLPLLLWAEKNGDPQLRREFVEARNALAAVPLLPPLVPGYSQRTMSPSPGQSVSGWWAALICRSPGNNRILARAHAAEAALLADGVERLKRGEGEAAGIAREGGPSDGRITISPEFWRLFVGWFGDDTAEFAGRQVMLDIRVCGGHRRVEPEEIIAEYERMKLTGEAGIKRGKALERHMMSTLNVKRDVVRAALVGLTGPVGRPPKNSAGNSATR